MNWGIHIIADAYNCDFNFFLSKHSLEDLLGIIEKIIIKNNLTIVWKTYFSFKKDAFTIAFLLAESHFTIHTWPESNYITLDIFVCNYHHNNTDNAKNIYEEVIYLLHPQEIKKRIIYR